MTIFGVDNIMYDFDASDFADSDSHSHDIPDNGGDILDQDDYLNQYVHTDSSNSTSSLLNHPDPLSQSSTYKPESLNLHHVTPHSVSGYTKDNGTVVDGYYRDGENGTGYFRTNPDDTTSNNLNQD